MDLIWLMVWLTCSSGGCYREVVEQEFYSEQECKATLDFYRARDGVAGVCTRYSEEEG